MSKILITEAEARATEAESLPAFSGLKLEHIKRQLGHLLDLIGRHDIFDQYTRHDMSHVDGMLKLLEWLIPQQTKAAMSPADWLLTVLGIYFHDVGLLVTKQEYLSREASDFPQFQESALFAGDEGKDYRAKVDSLPPNEAERFLYQEFVRAKHPERASAWVQGRAPAYLGVTVEPMVEIARLLSPVHETFRRDLGLVCESHHLDDLGNVRKYKVRQPYGATDEETANVQYCAVLLRTADLLHITSDRTPSVQFRVINPTDPLSQLEWSKQAAVRRVMSQVARGKEGMADEAAPRDTIEVHASFDQEDAFFGLTSYLSYASNQLRRNYEWVEGAGKAHATPHKYPWRAIDTSYVEAEGFLREQFSFAIDEARMLDLLTGHTLYNDTKVVLRELAQNALDAIRFQRRLDELRPVTAAPGRIRIHWDSKARVLSVEDNGTGMTQQIVDRHLLRVGASRYQDPEFRKEYPDFWAVSRFGIGVLSTFMIADTVEIITCHPDEPHARRLSLRSLHGKYLIRLLDKQSDPVATQLAPHGTLVRLKVRRSAEMPDVTGAARHWLVVPGCEVTVSVDDSRPMRVGFASPGEALTYLLRERGIRVLGDGDRPDEGTARVEERESPGVKLAYALRWSSIFQEWEFLSGSDLEKSEEPMLELCTCVGGVRVESATPGYDSEEVAAMADLSGPGSPRTNVARSGLEATPERDAMLRAVYTMYCEHVRREIEELQKSRGRSLTWAAAEATYLLAPLVTIRRGRGPVASELLLEQVAKLPSLVVERGGSREAVSQADLSREGFFWTSDCAFFRSAETLLREVKGGGSLCALVTACGASDFAPPEGALLCGFASPRQLPSGPLRNREIDRICIHHDQRRVDLRWVAASDPPRWCAYPHDHPLVPRELLRLYFARSAGPSIEAFFVADRGVEVTGASDELAVRSCGDTYVLPGSNLGRYLAHSWHRLKAEGTREAFAALFLVWIVGDACCHWARKSIDPEDLLRSIAQHLSEATSFRLRLADIPDLDTLRALIAAASGSKVFDSSAWVRKE